MAAKLIGAEVKQEAEEWENERQNDEKYLGTNIGRCEQFVAILLLQGTLFERHFCSPALVFVLKILFLLAGQYDGNPAIQGNWVLFSYITSSNWNNLDAALAIILNVSNV